MNKSAFIGLGIFTVIIISLLSISLTMDVNAQGILSGDSNVNVSYLAYQLNISELNLSNNISVTDNITNITAIVNVSNNITYDCELNITDGIYLYSGMTSGTTINITDIIIINQSVSVLTDEYHDLVLGCNYNISTSGYDNATNYTYTNNQTINKLTLKTILVDTISPNIILSNQSIMLYNGTALLNFTIIDESTMNCTTNIANTTSTFISNSSNISIPLNISEGNYSYNVSCKDLLNNTQIVSSLLQIISDVQNVASEIPFFSIDISKPTFSLGELGYYTINANNNSNVSIIICPIASGWVQCYMVLPFINETFPRTQAMPYTNKTGRYIIEGVMRYKNNTITANVTYETTNTLTANIIASKTTSAINEIITFNALATSGIGTYTYKWTLHDGTKFTGISAYKNYTTPGTYRVNLTVNDSVGNNYSTYIDVIVKNVYTLNVIVIDKKDNTRVNDATVSIDAYDAQTDTSGIATFKFKEGTYDIHVSKSNYVSSVSEVLINKDQTIYMNMSFSDLTPPKITLLTDNDVVLNKDAVDLKFQAEDITNVACSLYTANVNDSWYILKDSGDNLQINTPYTFEIRDLNNGAYKWKIECVDADKNKAYSEERKFIVSDGNITLALQSTGQNSDSINTALDNMNKLSGDESDVADILKIRIDLKELLDRINRVDKDIHDLGYRRDLDEKGIAEAQANLTQAIDYMKYHTPINLRITDSKTFVKYVHDEDLKLLLEEYSVIKNLKLDKNLFLESTKRVQSKVIISTHVRNVELYYLDGNIIEITLVTKDIQIAKPEDELSIKNSNSVSFVEVVPKTISQTVKQINMINNEYTVLKDDPLIEYPADTRSIAYYINGTIKPDEFQNTDTILIDKNINVIKSTTGLSILGISSLSDMKIEGQGIMLIIILLLVLFYLIVNFDIIDKIRSWNLGFVGFGFQKKVSFIRVLVNDALDYLKTEDYDKAALIYREIKLSYEEANAYVQKEVYDESFDLCNQLDLTYAIKVLDKAEYYINMQDRNKSIIEFEKLENTYHKLDDKYRLQIDERFKRVAELIKTNY